MTTPSRTRRLVLASAATLAATVWAAVQDDTEPVAPIAAAVARPTPRAPPGAAPDAGASAVSWPEPPNVLTRPTWRDAHPQALAAWGPPPPPPPPAPPPAAVAAPPAPPAFPYTLIGRMDDGQPTALLSGRKRSFGARAGDVIDGAWRVDAIAPEGVTLTWLPGGLSQTLSLPSS